MTMRTAVLSALLLASCAGGPKPLDEVKQMTDAQLLSELQSPAAREPSYLLYDDGYFSILFAEICARRKWPPGEIELISKRKIWVGATAEQVRISWCAPNSRSSYTSSHGTTEYWHYGYANPTTTVVIRNGVCDGWSSSR